MSSSLANRRGLRSKPERNLQEPCRIRRKVRPATAKARSIGAEIRSALPSCRNASESSPPNERRCNAAGAIRTITFRAVKQSAVVCISWEVAGSLSKPVVSMAMNWNPKSAWPPGIMTRASVNNCSTLVVSGVEFSFISPAPSDIPMNASIPNQKNAQAVPMQMPEKKSPLSCRNDDRSRRRSLRQGSRREAPRLAAANRVVVRSRRCDASPRSIRRCCITGATSSAIETTIRARPPRLRYLADAESDEKPS